MGNESAGLFADEGDSRRPSRKVDEPADGLPHPDAG
jgi:hypothetical protein